MSQFAEDFERLYRRLRNDIFLFAEMLGFRGSDALTWQQRKLLQLVQDGHRRIAVKSGHGTGKTAAVVIIGLWRAFRAVDALTVVVAPTMKQVKDQGFMQEARVLMAKADPLLRRFIKVHATTVVIAGRKGWGVRLMTANKKENAAGIHHKNLTIIADEATGIKRDIVETIEGALTNLDYMFVQIGNPTTRDCAFFDCFHSQRAKWQCLTFDSRESPIVNPERVRYFAEKFGVDSDVYRIRMAGEFPFQEPGCVISVEHVDKAIKSDPYVCMRVPDEEGEAPTKQFGIDFARFGPDESVIYRRLGLWVAEWKPFAHWEPAHVVDEAFLWQARCRWRDDECLYVPDSTGMGQGVLSKFYDAGKTVHEYHNHGTPVAEEYDNKVTEAWFHLADLFKRGVANIPDDPRLIQQLVTRKYYTTRTGKLILESKEDFKKRATDDVGGSPDRADAIAMCFYPHARVRAQVTSRQAASRRSLYDE